MQREELAAVLAAVKPGVSGGDAALDSSNFAFTGKHVITYNDEVSVRYPFKTEVVGAVPADKLLGFLGKASSDEVALEQTEEGELLIKCGRSRAGIPMIAEVPEHIEAMELPGKKEWSAVPEGFIEAVRFCLFSASRDLTKPILTNLHAAQDYVESCDNYRATRVEGVEMGALDLLIPAASARHLHNFKPVEMASGMSWLHFRNAEKAVLSCRLFLGEYPDLSGFLNWPGKKGTKLPLPDKLKEVLSRASVFSDAEFDSDRKVTLTARNGKLKVRAQGPDGWFEETVKADMGDLSFDVHPEFLQEVLGHSADAVLTEKAVLFRGRGFIHMVSL